MNKGWTKNSINWLLVKFGAGVRQRQTQCVPTDENVDTVESLLLSQRPPNSQKNFTWGGGIHWSSVSWIYEDLRLKCCKKRRAQQL